MLMHQTADLAVRETFRRGVHGQHQPAPVVRVALARVREDHELTRHELAAVVVAHRPGDEQQLILLYLALEEGLARPGALEGTALVAEHRVEHAQAPARRQDPRAHHAPDAGDLLPDVRLRDRKSTRL